MRIVRCTLLAIAATAAVTTTAAPAHAGTGVDLTFSTGRSDTGLPLPGATVSPRVGDPTTFVGTLQGVVKNTTVEPGSCELTLTPSPDGTSGRGSFGNCAATWFDLGFSYSVDPSGQVTAYAVTGGDSSAVTWRIDCWASYPPLSIGCKITASAA